MRLLESEIVAFKLIVTLGVTARVETYTNQRHALEGADFVIYHHEAQVEQW